MYVFICSVDNFEKVTSVISWIVLIISLYINVTPVTTWWVVLLNVVNISIASSSLWGLPSILPLIVTIVSAPITSASLLFLATSLAFCNDNDSTTSIGFKPLSITSTQVEGITICSIWASDNIWVLLGEPDASTIFIFLLPHTFSIL